MMVPADDTLDACTQLRQMERLRQVIVGTQVKPRHLVLDGVLGRDDDDILLLPHLLQLLQHSQPVAVRQHDVQQDTVIVVRADFHHGSPEVGSTLHDISFFLQRTLHQFAQGGFVFNDEQFHR